MNTRTVAILAMGSLLSLSAIAGDRGSAVDAIDEVLNTFHQAASDADGKLYFSLFTEGAIFLGTDATERWNVDQFEAFADPFFSKGRGWTYVARDRHIYVSAGGRMAWFDEILWNDAYGTCRGTGVFLLTDHGWRIAQYNLSIPIPNDLTQDFATRIKEFEKKPPG